MTAPEHLTFVLAGQPVDFLDGRFHSPDALTESDLNDALDAGKLRSNQPIIVPPLAGLALALQREYGPALTDVQVPDPPPLPEGAIV